MPDSGEQMHDELNKNGIPIKKEADGSDFVGFEIYQGDGWTEMTAARAYMLSSCRSYLLLEIAKFSACGAVLRQRRLFLCPNQEGHKAHRRNGRADGLYKLQAVLCC